MDTWSIITEKKVAEAKQYHDDQKETYDLSKALKNNNLIINEKGIALVPTLGNKVAQLQKLFSQKIGELNLIGRLIEVSKKSPDSCVLRDLNFQINVEKEPIPDADVESFVLTCE
jgi:hypothetical protein